MGGGKSKSHALLTLKLNEHQKQVMNVQSFRTCFILKNVDIYWICLFLDSSIFRFLPCIRTKWIRVSLSVRHTDFSELCMIFCKGQSLHEYAKLTRPNFFGKTCFSLNMQTFFISVGFRWTEMNVNGVGVFLVHSRVNQNCSSSLE